MLPPARPHPLHRPRTRPARHPWQPPCPRCHVPNPLTLPETFPDSQRFHLPQIGQVLSPNVLIRTTSVQNPEISLLSCFVPTHGFNWQEGPLLAPDPKLLNRTSAATPRAAQPCSTTQMSQTLSACCPSKHSLHKAPERPQPNARCHQDSSAAYPCREAADGASPRNAMGDTSQSRTKHSERRG